MSTRRNDKAGLFPALLKYWRGRRGMSQLDLALTADVSSRHVSFMETGRAQPSEQMILRLGAALDVPLREQNQMLRASGFDPIFEEPGLGGLEQPGVAMALERMLAQQEPYPMVVMTPQYDVLRTNGAADRMLLTLVSDPSAITPPLNALTALFDPRLIRPYVRHWDRVARGLLSRLHREVLHRPEDERLAAILEEVLGFPGVPDEWRQPNLEIGTEAVFTIRLKRGERELGFLTTMTVFNAPQNVTLEELRIESYFPLDDATERYCRDAATAAGKRSTRS